MKKRLDQQAPKHAYMTGGQKFLNRVGLTGNIKKHPLLRFSKTGMPYCLCILDFHETDTRLTAGEARNHYNEIQLIVSGDRAKVFCKHIVRHDRVMVFGTLTNGRRIKGKQNELHLRVMDFHWLGNMEKYLSEYNPLASKRNEHYKKIRAEKLLAAEPERLDGGSNSEGESSPD